MDRKQNSAFLMFVTSMLIFGTIGIFRKFIPLSSGFLAFARGLIGGVFLIVFVKLKGRSLFSGLDRRTIGYLVLSGALIGVNWILLFEAYNYTSVSTATLCYYMQPIIVILASPVLFRERMTIRKVLCVIIALLGMYFVSGASLNEQNSNAQGILFGLGAALLYAVVVIMNKKLRNIDAFDKTILQLLSAAAVMVPYLLITGTFSGLEINSRSAVLLLVVGIIHTGIAYVLYFGSIENLKAQTIALFSYIDPVSALLFSALLLHESFTTKGLIGAVMVLGAAVFSEIKRDNIRE